MLGHIYNILKQAFPWLFTAFILLFSIFIVYYLTVERKKKHEYINENLAHKRELVKLLREIRDYLKK